MIIEHGADLDAANAVFYLFLFFFFSPLFFNDSFSFFFSFFFFLFSFFFFLFSIFRKDGLPSMGHVILGQKIV